MRLRSALSLSLIAGATIFGVVVASLADLQYSSLAGVLTATVFASIAAIIAFVLVMMVQLARKG
jgi:hypothetical protein